MERGDAKLTVTALLAASLLATTVPAQDAAGPTTTWGYVASVDGATVVLDDGTSLQLSDNTVITRIDGAPGAPTDITQRIKVEATLDAAGSATRLDLLPAPLSAEYYLSTMTVRGATALSVEVGGRGHPRSLAALKATLTGRTDTVALSAGLAYLPPEGAAAPDAATFSVIDAASNVLFQRTVAKGQVAQFRLNHPAGQAQTLTLVAAPAGGGALQPEWCLWLDPKLVAPLPAAAAMSVYRSTVEKLVADLRAALGENQPGPVAVCLFTGIRISDNQLLSDLQEDLVVYGLGPLQIAGSSAQRPELGVAIADGVKAELTKMGASCALVGSVSDRGEILVVNAALVKLDTGEIIATARAWQ